MLDYIAKVFGTSITSAVYTLPKNIPYYLARGYSVQKLIMHGNECLLISPRNSEERLPVLKKHYGRFLEISGMPCVLNLEKLTASQRENLISCHTPFVSEKQIYLPFWGAVFETHIKMTADAPKAMSPTDQLVFLAVFYRLTAGKKASVSLISTDLSLPKSSVSTAIKALSALKLITVIADGTSKWISLNGCAAEVLQAALKAMPKPASKEIYLKRIPEGIHYKLGGIRALSETTMLSANDRDGAYVYDKVSATKISKEFLISRQEFNDFGGYKAEIWRYDPSLLTEGPIVDDISLLASLNDCEDERVQKELDNIREKYGLIPEEA